MNDEKSIALALLLCSFTGCGPGSSERGGGAPGFTQTDSAGIIVSVTQGEEARRPIGWEVDSIPDLVIGAGDSTYLYRVQGVRALQDGGVLVVDGGSRELRFFDSRGRLINRAGGEGQGPGEFRDPVLVPWVGSDSLLVFDRGGPRLQVFSGDGLSHRTIQYQYRWPAGSRPPLGAANLHVLLVEDGSFVGGEASMRRPGRHQRGVDFYWYDPATDAAIPLDYFEYDVTYESATWEVEVLHSPRPAAVVIESGVLITDGGTSEIREYDLEGRLRRIVRVNQPGRPVTPEMIGDARVGITTLSNVAAPLRRAIMDELPIPDTLPAIRSLLVDSRGWLWAEVYDWDKARPKEWMVFDPEGRARGVVWTPPGLEVESIGEDFILGVWQDELEVEYVRRHVMRRGQTTGGAR